MAMLTESSTLNKHYTVFEFIEKVENNINVYDETKSKQDKIDSEMFQFAKKLIDNSFINGFDYNVIRSVELTLKYNKLSINMLKCKFENGKATYYYLNDSIIYFIKMLYAVSTKRNTFYEFLKVPDVYDTLKNLYYSDIFFYETKYLNIEGLSLKTENVIEILEFLGLMDSEYRQEFYLLSGCSLLIYELREEVSDIDLCVSKKAFKMLNSKFSLQYCGRNKYRIGNLIEIFVSNKEDFKCKFKNGFLVENLSVILDFKLRRKGCLLGTKKGRKNMSDIYIISNYLTYHEDY